MLNKKSIKVISIVILAIVLLFSYTSTFLLFSGFEITDNSFVFETKFKLSTFGATK